MSSKIKVPKKRMDREVGEIYLLKGEVRIWNGKMWHCKHNRKKNRCKECGGSGICEHNKRKNTCKECGGASICEHNRMRNVCKECGGSRICEHEKRKYACKECGGSSICEHNKRRSVCKECGGASICGHGKQRCLCRECGGSSFCEHKRRRDRCKECGGFSFCVHKTRTSRCKECGPNGYLTSLMRNRVYDALKKYSNPKTKKTMEYVGCDVETLGLYIEKQFKNGMNWENQGGWHIDHRRPCASFDLNIEEERHKCFHYTNLQPMWGSENMSKGDSYNETTFTHVWNGEKEGWNIKF